MKKVKIYYDQTSHESDNFKAYDNTKLFNSTVKELESIIKKPIEDYQALKKDAYNYSLETIKKTFPKPFDLGLDLETTLKMLSIDMTNLKSYAEQFDSKTECVIIDGYAKNEVDQERFKQYCESEEQFVRYDFAVQCIDTIQKAVSYTNWLRPQDLASYYKSFVESSFDTDGKVKLSVRVQFVLTGN